MPKPTSKDKIIDTAISVFSKKGFAETSINDIAEAASISVGLMYRYFKSKQDLFEKIIEIAVGGIQEITQMLIGSDNPQDTLKSMCLEMIEAMNDERYMNLNKMIIQGLISQDHFAFSKILTADEKMIDAVCELIKKGQMQGVFAQGDAVAKAHLFIATVQGMTMTKSAFKEKFKPPTVGDMMAFLIKGAE